MSMFTAFNISASGMTAQQLRTDVISQNIANANTTRTSDGTPYVKKSVVFTDKTVEVTLKDTDICTGRVWNISLLIKELFGIFRNICRCIKSCKRWHSRRWC